MGSLANADPKYFKGEIKIWNEWMEHGDYDEYWQAQRVSQHLNKVTPAVMTVGGWFDAEDVQGPLSIYQAIEKSNPKAWNVLVEGPWRHGCWSQCSISWPPARRPGKSLSSRFPMTPRSVWKNCWRRIVKKD
jgi:predicted acyl esterase